jgi:hypothetical protein
MVQEAQSVAFLTGFFAIEALWIGYLTFPAWTNHTTLHIGIIFILMGMTFLGRLAWLRWRPQELERSISMIERVKTHNRLNGYRFSTLEFSLIILILVPFAGYYFIYQQWLFAMITLGIMVNCLPIVLWGIKSWQAKKDTGHQMLFDSKQRAIVRQENPHLLFDTILIAFSTLLPYVLLGWILLELGVLSRFR